MFASFKTLLCVLVGLAATGYFVFGTEMVPYTKTAVKSVRGSVKEAIGVDFDLDRASMELEESQVELQEFRKKVAELEVDLEDQESRKRATQEEIEALEAEVDGLTTAYENSGYGAVNDVRWKGLQLSAKQAENRLNSCLQRLEYLGNHHEILVKVIAERKETLNTAEQTLNQGVNRREELALLLESCRFELECDKIMGSSLDFEYASGSLGEAEQILTQASKNSRVNKKVREGNKVDFVLNGSTVVSGADLVKKARSRNGNRFASLENR